MFQEVEVVAWTDGTYPVWIAVTKARITIILGRIVRLDCFLKPIIMRVVFLGVRRKLVLDRKAVRSDAY